MPQYEVRWRETYEMSAVVDAANHEEALARAVSLADNTPSLDSPKGWIGDDAVHTEAGGARVDAELVDKLDPVCFRVDAPKEERGGFPASDAAGHEASSYCKGCGDISPGWIRSRIWSCNRCGSIYPL